MANDTDGSKTFADLDRDLGLLELPSDAASEFPLPEWYRSVRQTPLDKLSIGDLCRACGQSIHLQQVVPLAIAALEQDALAGDAYEGQLASSLVAVPRQFWLQNRSLANICHRVAQTIPSDDDFDFRKDIALLIERTTTSAT